MRCGIVYVPTIEECEKCKYQRKCDEGRKCIHDGNLPKAHHRARPIGQYDIDGNFLEEFESISKASKHIRLSSASIFNALTGRAKTAGGYQWKYL